MGTITQEEKILKKRLVGLEKKYHETLFSERSLKERTEEQIKKDIKRSLESDKDKQRNNEIFREEPKSIFKPEDFELKEEDLEEKEVKKPEILPLSKEPKFKKLEIFPLAEKSKLNKPKLSIFKKPGLKIPEIKKQEKSLIEKHIISNPKHPPSEVKENFQIPELDIKKKYGEVKLKKKRPMVKKPSADEIKQSLDFVNSIKKEIGRAILGQEEIVDGLILGLLCNAHVLVEGVPGIAKTLAIRSLAAASGCSVKRVQFTVDMLPTDIIGITSYTPQKGFEVVKGPIFANFVIGDEINRAPPKTQSSLIEAMQEKQVTIGREKFHLPAPFFVMATENPIENAGVYPLPEAQIDRFLFKLIMRYPDEETEREVMGSNMTLQKFEDFKLKPVVSPKDIVKIQEIVKKVYLDESIRSYILSIVRKTRDKDFKSSEFVSYGASPRASIGLFIASKARALMQGRDFVLPEDVKSVVYDVMRHRLILSYKATVQKISPDEIIKEILNSIRVT